MGKKRSARLNTILRDEGQELRQAGKRKSIVSLLRDRSSKPALLDDFYALILSHFPNLQTLALHVSVQQDRLVYGARSQSMDQLAPALFKTLENLSIFAFTPLKHGSYATATKCPKFVTSLLKFESLRKYSTDRVFPDKLPTTNITTFDTGTLELIWPWVARRDRSRYFFDGGAKIDTLIWNSRGIGELCTSFPESVRRLVLCECTNGWWRYEQKYDAFLGGIEDLHLHCKVISHANSTNLGPHGYYARPLDGWLVLLSPTIRTLRIFGLENLKNAVVFGSQLFKIRSAYHRYPLIGPIQFQAKISSEEPDFKKVVKQEFEGIKKACGAVPIEFSIKHSQV